jgi:hypothetical protein
MFILLPFKLHLVYLQLLSYFYLIFSFSMEEMDSSRFQKYRKAPKNSLDDKNIK